MDKILLMLQLQDALNRATNGENWTSGITKNAKVINWRRCIYMECAEMIESFSWKHWKNIDKEADWANLQIEVVDVWHFIMSLMIENLAQSDFKIEDLAKEIATSKNFSKLESKNTFFAEQSLVMEKIESIMFDSLSKEKLNTQKFIADFFDLVNMSALDLGSLYKLYVGKNILNTFRQDHGYKDGSYIKVWDKMEDNVVMQRILDENSDIKPDDLYKKLEIFYATLSKS